MKKKIVVGLMAVMCFMPCFLENISECAEVMAVKQTDTIGSSEACELLLNAFAAHSKMDFFTELKYVEEGIARYPDIAYFYLLRADLYRYPKINKRDEIIQNLDKAIDLDPIFIRAYTMRGDEYLKKRQFDKAVADYDRAIELDPATAYPYRMRAYAYRRCGQTDKAIADYTRVIEIAPNYATREYYGRAKIYYDGGRYNEVIKDCTQLITECEKVINSRDKNAASDNHKVIHVDENLFFIPLPAKEDEGIKALDREIKAEYWPNAYVLRGRAYYELGNYKDALADGKKALSFKNQAIGAQSLVNLAKKALEKN